MITRFHSFEDAAIHAGVMRSQGHAAVVIDEVIGLLYGPLFSNGFRVWASDEPVTDGEDAGDGPDVAGEAVTPESQGAMRLLFDAVRLIAGALMTTGGLAIGIALVVGLIHIALELKELMFAVFSGNAAGALVSLLLWLVAFLGFAGFATCGGPLMVRMTAALRNEASAFGWTARALVVAWVVTFLFGLVGRVLYLVFSVLLQMCGVIPPAF